MIVLVGSGRAQGKREGPKLERQRASFSSTLYYRNSQVIFLIPKTIEKRQLWKWYQGMACFCFLLFASIQLCRSKFTGRLLFPFCSTLLLVQNQNPLFFSLFLGKIILQHFCFISLFEPLLFVICYLLHDGHWIYYDIVNGFDFFYVL